MKIEASTLQEAITKASEKLECSVLDLKIDVIQHPSGGVFGLFKKNAIINASIENDNKKSREKESKNNIIKKDIVKSKKQEQKNNKEKAAKKQSPLKEPKSSSSKTSNIKNQKKDRTNEMVNIDSILSQIQNEIEPLFSTSFFDIKTIEVSKFDEKTVFVKLDGDDAALLIGKEGARYKAISTLLYNYLNLKYGLYVKLEIAEFYQNQEKMIASYLQDIFAKVEKNGKAQTRPLDGILIKIALEQLREKYPEKYVGVRSSKHGKFIIINDKNKK